MSGAIFLPLHVPPWRGQGQCAEVLCRWEVDFPGRSSMRSAMFNLRILCLYSVSCINLNVQILAILLTLHAGIAQSV